MATTAEERRKVRDEQAERARKKGLVPGHVNGRLEFSEDGSELILRFKIDGVAPVTSVSSGNELIGHFGGKVGVPLNGRMRFLNVNANLTPAD